MSLLHDLFFGFGIAFQPINLLTCFIGVFIGTLIGVLPGIGPVGAMSLLLPVTFGMSPVSRGDHAGRHILRIHVWRVYHVDPRQYSRGGCVCRDLSRRLPDGLKGARRTGARHCRLRFLHRRHAGHRGTDARRKPARGVCTQVRAARVFFPHGAGPLHSYLPYPRLPAPWLCHGSGSEFF